MNIYRIGRRRKMNRKKICVVLLLMLLLSVVAASGDQGAGNVYVIPIRGEITPAMHLYVKHNLSIVESDKNATAVIFEIDTYGGRIDSSEQIGKLILNTNIPTISFVNTKAESAGVLLTISSDTIAMAPSSTIGSAETVPNTEKVLSTWVGILRSTAQKTGRDETIVSAMADKSVVIPGVSERGRLLNLTNVDAILLDFIDFIANDYNEVLDYLSLSDHHIIMAETTNSIRLAQFASNLYIAPILLAIGIIGILIELFMPGFGIGGTIGLISLAVYFAGNMLAGNGNFSTVLIFVLGIILLITEAAMPGFGIAGIGGVLCIGVSIFLISNSIVTAVLSVTVILILTIIAILLLYKFAPKNKYFNRIILNAKLDKNKGYTSTVDYSKYVNQTGIVTTALRPSGIISIDGELLDVVSEGQFIEKDEIVMVSKVEGRKIVVRKMN